MADINLSGESVCVANNFPFDGYMFTYTIYTFYYFTVTLECISNVIKYMNIMNTTHHYV